MSSMNVSAMRRTASPRDYPTRRLGCRLGSTTAFTVYEVPANVMTRVDLIFACMTQAGSTTYTIHHCVPGETPSTANALYYQRGIAANATDRIEGPIWMTSGDRLFVLGANADHVCFTVYGEEM